jgi:hypothetical protein
MAPKKGHLDKRFVLNFIVCSQHQTQQSLFSEVLLVAQLSVDSVIDKIPLIEIKMVREMMDIEDEGENSKDGNDFMIETDADGYNSGRTYYLQADSSAECRDISNKISLESKLAVDRANAKTAIAQAQQRVRRFYSSAIFQNLVAFLILTVGKDLFPFNCDIAFFPKPILTD